MTEKLTNANVLYVMHRKNERCRIPLRVETEDGFYTRTATLIDDMLTQVQLHPHIASFTHEFTGGQLVVNIRINFVVTEEWRDLHEHGLHLIAQEHHAQGFNRVDDHDRYHLEMELDEYNAELERAQEREFKLGWPQYKSALIMRLVRAFEDEGVTARLLRKCVRFRTHLETSNTYTFEEMLTLDDLP